MKNSLLKGVGTGLLGLTLAVVAFNQPATAQVDQPTTRTIETRDDGFNWGLLGLFGLLGLGGLMRGDRDHATVRDTATAGTHTTRT